MAEGTGFKALTDSELIEFESTYSEILNRLIDHKNNSAPELEVTTKWMIDIMNYNVPKGKKIRGLMVATTLKNVSNNPKNTQMHLAYVLGWCLEILQAASLVADDIMDRSETRRGQQCWYKVEGVGLTAINDCFMLQCAAYKVLNLYFEHETYYLELMHTVRNIVFKTIIGQNLDYQLERKEDICKSFTMERYLKVIKFKTGYYTCVLPVVSALVMLGRAQDKKTLEIVEDVLLDIGNYFQIQDDFLDCFGSSDITGKIGTDIQDNKCTWLVVKALHRCDKSQLEYLVNNYGYEDLAKVVIVKNLYKDLNLMNEFKQCEEETFERIPKKIKHLPNKMLQHILIAMLEKLYKRTK